MDNSTLFRTNRPEDNPRLIFISGGPGSGKGTQCEKLVEEFGFCHISTGDLMRDEIRKGSKEGETIKRLSEKGELVPIQITVDLLLKAIINKKASNYLIDGYPRSLEQALYFERHVTEISTMVYFECPDETLVERLLYRGKSSGRADDNIDTIRKRIETFKSETMEFLNFYSKFGKSVNIDATKDINQIYAQTRAAIFPNTYFVVGAPKSGKSTLCERVASRMNIQHIDVDALLASKKLKNASDAQVIETLRDYFLTNNVSHVSIENFPKNILQAKLYEKAFKAPQGVVYLECERDICQERIMEIDPKSAHYIDSAQLSKKCNDFYGKIDPLLAHLKNSCRVITLNGNQVKNHVVRDFIKETQPTILCLGGPNEELRDSILKQFKEEKFFEVNIPELVKKEAERQTKLGIEFSERPHPGQDIPSHLYINLARKVIYSLQDSTKYVISGFPFTVEQAENFETHCCNFNGFIAATSPGADLALDDGSQDFGLAHFFANRGQLFKFNDAFDMEELNSLMGQKKPYSIVFGAQGSGKSLISKYIADLTDAKVVDIAAVIEMLKTKLAEEDGDPLETVPLPELWKELKSMIEGQAVGSKVIFDSLPIEWNEEVVNDLVKELGSPNEVFFLKVALQTVEDRIKAKEEIEELGEEQKEEAEKNFAHSTKISDLLREYAETKMTNFYDIEADVSLASLKEDIRNLICPKIILTRIVDDVPEAAGLIAKSAVQHDALFIDVPQVLKSHVSEDNDFGREIVEFKNRQILTPEELEQVNRYNPSVFPQPLVMNILKDYMKKNRLPSQQFVILNGYPHSDWWKTSESGSGSALTYPRPIDEINAIESNLGVILSVISVTHDLESLDQQFEYFELEKVEEVKPVKPEGEGEDGEEAEEAAPEDGEEGEDAKPKFIKEDYSWSDTNGAAASLPQYFKNSRPCYHFEEIDVQGNLGEQVANLVQRYHNREDGLSGQYSYVQFKVPQAK